MPRVTRTVEDVDYAFATIPIGVARRMAGKYPDQSDFNVAFISASMQAAGNPDATMEFVDSLPFYAGGFETLLGGAFEANGLEIKKKPALDPMVQKVGEDVPEQFPIELVPATASTSDLSTEVSAGGTATP